MTTTEVNTSATATASANQPTFVKQTNTRVNAAMRGFFGQLMEPFIDAFAKVKKTLGGHEEVSNNTLSLVQSVMAVRNDMSESANNPEFKMTGSSIK